MLTRRKFLSIGLMVVIACCTWVHTIYAAPRKLKKKESLSRAPFPKNNKNSKLKSSQLQENTTTLTEEEIKDYFLKMRNFDKPFPTDIILQEKEKALLNSIMAKLTAIQNIVGHGKFYLLGIDEAINIAKRSSIENFSRKETLFLEELFYIDASNYGFMDKKPLKSFTTIIPQNNVYKVPGMGNFIYKGLPQKKWAEIQKIIGKDVVLTSGVRGIIKQFYLFLTKAQRHNGNLSLASRSLAPPGYSFHGIGDFDVGQRGFGYRNFTADFTTTSVYKQLSVTGYLSLRYPKDNFLGVRFEPWHVKVVSS